MPIGYKNYSRFKKCSDGGLPPSRLPSNTSLGRRETVHGGGCENVPRTRRVTPSAFAGCWKAWAAGRENNAVMGVYVCTSHTRAPTYVVAEYIFVFVLFVRPSTPCTTRAAVDWVRYRIPPMGGRVHMYTRMCKRRACVWRKSDTGGGDGKTRNREKGERNAEKEQPHDCVRDI